MFKRDKIFYSACGLSAIGIILAIMGYELNLLLFIAAYLLRPAIHEFGLGEQFADERELEVHSQSGNLAFVVLILVMVGMIFWRMADGEPTGELYTLIGIGLAARALSGLIINGEYRKAGVVIISSVGVLLALFILLMGGFSMASLFGAILGLLIVGFGQLARKFPKTISIGMTTFAIAFVVVFELYNMSRSNLEVWLLFITPIIISSVCLFLGGKKGEESITKKTRSIVFGSLGVGVTLLFALLLIAGSKEQMKRTKTEQVPEGEVTIVQDVPCKGTIEYYDDGSLMHCSLAYDDTLSGQPFAAGTGVHFTEDGTFEWCFLREETEIQGYLCKGEAHGFMTRFYPNGQIRTAWLAKDQVIQGIPCAKFQFLSAVVGWAQDNGKNGSTGFHSNGKLRHCELSENHTIEGISFRRGDLIKFDQDGKLINTN